MATERVMKNHTLDDASSLIPSLRPINAAPIVGPSLPG
jgi:hypothetical protein